MVDFPTPVGPVTNINPLSLEANSFKISGKFSSSKVLTCKGIARIAAAIVPLWKYKFPLNLPTFSKVYEKSNSLFFRILLFVLKLIMYKPYF